MQSTTITHSCGHEGVMVTCWWPSPAEVEARKNEPCVHCRAGRPYAPSIKIVPAQWPVR